MLIYTANMTHRGDLFVFFSDGILEAQDRDALPSQVVGQHRQRSVPKGGPVAIHCA